MAEARTWDTTKTSGLFGALTDHYRKPGEARDGEILITEAAPPGSQRRIDLLRIGMWASRGYGIDGHELKTSRADWRRELDDKGKAEAWWPYVHRWWIVAPSTDVVPPDELPEGWGLLVPGRGRRFKAVVKAATKEPKITAALMVELLRRADNARLNDIEVMRQRHREELRRARNERIEQASKAQLDPLTRERLELLGQLEQVLGVELSDFGWGKDRATPAELGQVLVDQLRDGISIERARRQFARRLEVMLGHHQGEAKRLKRDLDELGVADG